VDGCADVYAWFSKSLVLFSHQRGMSAKLLFEDPALCSEFERLLPMLDTGIERIVRREIPLSDLRLPSGLKRDLEAVVAEGEYHELPPPHSIGGVGFVTRKNGELRMMSLVPYHRPFCAATGHEGEETEFDLTQESDGTIHLIKILPAIIRLAQGKEGHVFFIDDLTRDLHPNMTIELLNSFLLSCTQRSRSQLVFTTHDCNVTGHFELCLEEIWLCDRHPDGGSELICVAGYEDIESGMDIRDMYLFGNLRGIPRLVQAGLAIQ